MSDDRVKAFNKSRDLSRLTDWPDSPVLEVMSRRVFANLRPVGSPKPEGGPKSGDPQFDRMMDRIKMETSR